MGYSTILSSILGKLDWNCEDFHFYDLEIISLEPKNCDYSLIAAFIDNLLLLILAYVILHVKGDKTEKEVKIVWFFMTVL